ncbi:MAG TPA: MarR family transcriptional regulator [Gammaproteobacteria bacterium]|nr:MarR family transcriptional regulator [Gammaproteobacteria bacterium]
MQHNNHILTNALAAFEETTGLPAVQIPMPAESVGVQLRLGDAPALCAEIKKTLRPATLGIVVANLHRFNRPAVLVAGYVTPQMAEKLKELDIPFLDVAGNVYLKTPNTFIYVSGKKPKEPGPQCHNRAFRAAGLKVIFTLLTLQGQLKASTREIASNAGVANGTVSNIIKDLEQQGFAYRSKTKGLVLQNRDKLIDKWVEAYPLELRPQLTVQRFHIQHTDWWREFTYDRWQEYQMWLGGEPAAALLSKYLYPEIITVYGRPDFRKLAQVVKQPVRDEHGNFELLEPFWDFETPLLDEVHRLCPPLLIYADLVATGDARHRDVANLIRDKYLHGG